MQKPLLGTSKQVLEILDHIVITFQRHSGLKLLYYFNRIK